MAKANRGVRAPIAQRLTIVIDEELLLEAVRVGRVEGDGEA